MNTRSEQWPSWRMLAMCAACALALCMACAPQAFAYYALDPVDIKLSSASVTIDKGSSSTVACTVSPESERQLPGCGMAECPQGCGDLSTPDGVVGGCQNDEGWCTCAGLTYVKYTTKVTVTSSAPNVARASWSGGSLTVKGYSPGKAVIEVKASLSKHVDSFAKLEVVVPEPPAAQQEQPAAAADEPAKSAAADDAGSSEKPVSSSSATAAGSTGDTADAAGPAEAPSGSGESSSASQGASSQASPAAESSSALQAGPAGVSVSKAGKSASRGASGATVATPASGGASHVGTTAVSVQAVDSPAGEVADAGDNIPESSESGGEQAPSAKADDHEQFTLDGAGDAASAVSGAAVSAVPAQGASGGAGTAVAVVGTACIALAAGAFRYGYWRREHAPVEE